MSKFNGIVASIALFTLLTSGQSAASCWASNPDGNRSCGNFVDQYGLQQRLCEDRAGDCEEQGYAQAVPQPRKSARSVPSARATTRESAGSAHEELPSSEKTPVALEENPAWKANTPNVASSLAIVLSLLLGTLGFSLLPPAHRTALLRGGGALALTAVVTVVAFAAGVMAGASSSGRRRRY